jgi:hypothetical protein
MKDEEIFTLHPSSFCLSEHTVQIQIRIRVELLEHVKPALLCHSLHFCFRNQMAIAIAHSTALPRHQRITRLKVMFVNPDGLPGHDLLTQPLVPLEMPVGHNESATGLEQRTHIM